ncbi:acyltransferase [Gordonia sp. ABSL1-1]|uniref:acyltransferase family protein n=1 Tax=Gordonia sp. ABSL1-1 TaxID=3053923 RepID=UPI002573367C|nr:acyltransferase [Gordonia sp. ABSL1-1]MDL9937994.1 acyltransferase [Gordonia sp. ABSL1-1]
MIAGTSQSTRSGDTGPSGASASAPANRAPRALTADFVRVSLFTLVVVTHSVNAISWSPDVIRESNLVGTLLHMTRYGFVAVTLFVLVLSMRGRTMSARQFWRRRFGLVVAPYLIWSVIYAAADHVIIKDNPFPDPATFFTTLAHDIATGEAKYQLYFLLISMQIYLLFPLLSKLLDRFGDRPWQFLAVAAAIQLTMSVVFQYLPRPSGWDLVYAVGWKTLPMYTLFMAMGLLAAHHKEAVEQWLRDHAFTVVAVAGCCAAFSITAYLLNSTPGLFPESATTAWNPATLPWLVSGFALLWLIALLWNDRATAVPGRSAAAVSWATLRAFGVFAVHPLILDILARAGFFDLLFAERFPGSHAIRAIVLVVTLLTLALLTVELLLRLPFSKYLVARDRIPVPIDPIRELVAKLRTRGDDEQNGVPAPNHARRHIDTQSEKVTAQP